MPIVSEESRLILETTEKEENRVLKYYSETKLQEGDIITINMMDRTIKFERSDIPGKKLRIFLCSRGKECDHLFEPEEFQLKEEENKQRIGDEEAIRLIQLVSALTGLPTKGITKDDARHTMKGSF